MLEGLIGVVICGLLYKMSRSLGKIESTLDHVVIKIDDHEDRIRTLERPE